MGTTAACQFATITSSPIPVVMEYESVSLTIDFDEPTKRDPSLTGSPTEDAAFYDRPRGRCTEWTVSITVR